MPRLRQEHIMGGGDFSKERFLIGKKGCNSLTFKDYLISIKEDEFLKRVSKDFSRIFYRYHYANKTGSCLLTIEEVENTKEEFTHSMVYLRYKNTFRLKSFYDKYIKDVEYKKPEVKKPKFGLIYSSSSGIDLIENEIDPVEIDADLNYNMSFPIDKIIEKISEPRSGLILLQSKPGAGKSYFIKYLSQITGKSFVYVQNDKVEVFSNPHFTKFCINYLKGKIIILEDAERILRSRKQSNNYEISNILNITDGILGDILGIKIIATLNLVDNVDTALLRKGRLLCQSEFNALTPEQATKLSSKLGKNVIYKEPVILSDVYNTEETGKMEERKAIGFNVGKEPIVRES